MRPLPLHDVSYQSCLGHAAAITGFALHPEQPHAATVDASGTALLWSTQPLAPVNSLPPPQVQSIPLLLTHPLMPNACCERDQQYSHR